MGHTEARPLKRSDHSAETLSNPQGALKPDQGHLRVPFLSPCR